MLGSLLFIFAIILTLVLALRAKQQNTTSKKYFFLAFAPFLLAVSFGSMVYFFVGLLQTNALSLSVILFDVFQLAIIFKLTCLALISGHRTNAIKAAQLAEQKNLNQAISRFVPNEFLSALGKTNITDIQLGDSMEKEVTVFFSDIRAYTTLSEQMTPTENFEFVNAYNARMGPIIRQSNGFINQYLGDGIMAIFPGASQNVVFYFL